MRRWNCSIICRWRVVPKKTLTAGTFAGPDTDCVAGNEVKDALMWPLSTKEANAVNTDLRTLDSAGETAWAWLENAGRKEIDALILSHLHEDHANGVLYLFLGFFAIARKPVNWGFYGPCPSKLS